MKYIFLFFVVVWSWVGTTADPRAESSDTSSIYPPVPLDYGKGKMSSSSRSTRPSTQGKNSFSTSLLHSQRNRSEYRTYSPRVPRSKFGKANKRGRKSPVHSASHKSKSGRKDNGNGSRSAMSSSSRLSLEPTTMHIMPPSTITPITSIPSSIPTSSSTSSGPTLLPLPTEAPAGRPQNPTSTPHYESPVYKSPVAVRPTYANCPDIALDSIRGYPNQPTIREISVGHTGRGGQWGWYLEFTFTESNALVTFQLYAGEGNNDPAAGTYVGNAEVIVGECNNADNEETSYVNFNIPSADAGICVLTGEEHVHVSYELPVQVGAPGQYRNRCCKLNELCYVILHTSVAQYYCPEEGDTGSCSFGTIN